MLASKYGYLAMVDILLKHTAQVDLQNDVSFLVQGSLNWSHSITLSSLSLTSDLFNPFIVPFPVGWVYSAYVGFGEWS